MSKRNYSADLYTILEYNLHIRWLMNLSINHVILPSQKQCKRFYQIVLESINYVKVTLSF